jgi:tetratricopeptide (TPR) repeat protein
MAIISSFSCLAQKTKATPAVKKMEHKQKELPKLLNNPTTAVKTEKIYNVKENINPKFGSRTTTYSVSDKRLVRTNDLGPNNTRVVTSSFTEEKVVTEHKQLLEQPIKVVTDSLIKHDDYAYVFMLKTYERVAEKGYKSIDIFKKLSNGLFFNKQYEKAARWYGELFAMTTDLEPEYYYRYGHSLKVIGENDKANAMLAQFYEKVANNNSQDSSKK